MRFIALIIVAIGSFTLLSAQTVTLPSHPYFTAFELDRAVAQQTSQLQKGDRLAICGDSITEQKMYSRIIETYLTVCVPDLEISVRQFGWSGERAPGFYQRMANDVLRFNPTIATTCYGMNDHRYQPFTEEIGQVYREASEAIITTFKGHGVRVIQGAPGTVGKMPSWVRSAKGTVLDLNLGLMALRNIDVALAKKHQVGFADVYQHMLVQGFAAQQRIAKDYMLTGKDGVHPGWAGQLVMAYAFLAAMGLDGEIGTITLDLANGRASSTKGHQVQSSTPSKLTIQSQRYPFCATGDLDSDNSIRSGMTLVPFNQNLNRFSLRLRNATAQNYQISWGSEKQVFSRAKLSSGINLADVFPSNPFSEAFAKVDKTVAAKQSYETRQIKTLFHGPEGKNHPDETAALTERVRLPLANAIKSAFQPVTHTIRIKAL